MGVKSTNLNGDSGGTIQDSYSTSSNDHAGDVGVMPHCS